MGAHVKPEVATQATADFNKQALANTDKVKATCMAIITDEAGDVWACVIPEVFPRDRSAWLQSFGINTSDLWPTRYYAFGWHNEHGTLVLDGTDEDLKDLIPAALQIWQDTSEELFPLTRPC